MLLGLTTLIAQIHVKLMGKKAVAGETKWQVIGMNKLNVSNREIGRRLNISESCVRTTIKNFEASDSVNDKLRSGRPRKLSTRGENMLYTLSRRNPKAGVSELSGQINGSGVGCHEIYEGRLNQYRYREILENALAPCRDLFEADQTRQCSVSYSSFNHRVFRREQRSTHALASKIPRLEPD
jgi:transposase